MILYSVAFHGRFSVISHSRRKIFKIGSSQLAASSRGLLSRSFRRLCDANKVKMSGWRCLIFFGRLDIKLIRTASSFASGGPTELSS